MAGIQKTTTQKTSTASKTTSTKKATPAKKPEVKKADNKKPAVKDTTSLSKEKPGKAPTALKAGLADSFAKPEAKPETKTETKSESKPFQADPRQNVEEIGGLSVSTAALAKGKLSGSPVDSDGVVKAMADNNALSKGGAEKFDPSKFQDTVSKNPGDPFTGSGATGKNVLDSSMPIGDMMALNRHKQADTDLKSLRDQRDQLDSARTPAGLDEAGKKRFEEMRDNRLQQLEGNIKMSKNVQHALDPTYQSYQNPLGTQTDPKLNDPEQRWDAKTREDQARLMMEQPINTLHKDAYGDKLPTRAEVIEAAAKKNNLDPKVLGGTLLQEQRDQSLKEDAADIGGARLGGGNTSIGLGQVTVGTAMKNKNDLFADTIPDAKVRENLTRDEVAKLLTSDEHNIFAAARYMRSSADKGQTLGTPADGLSTIKSRYPGFDPKSLSGSKWNADTIKAMAGDYSANSFNQNLAMNPGYPEFVNLAVEDITRAGIFK